MIKKLLLVTAVATPLALGGCNLTQTLTNIDTSVKTYAPLVGKDLLLIGDIAVTAYCSPLTDATGKVTSNILNIVAPNSSTASGVQNVLNTNSQISNQLCPLVKSIQVAVGPVPAGTPSQTIPTTAAALKLH